MLIKNIGVFVFLMVAFGSAKAQGTTFGATLNLGFSRIISDVNFSNQDILIKPSFSGNAGLFGEISIGERSQIGAELLWLQMEGNETVKDMEITVYDSGQLVEVGRITSTYRIHISYFSLPVYYRFKFNKLGIKGGFQTMFTLMSSSTSILKGTLYNEAYDSKNKTSNLPLNKINYGPKLGFDYQFSNKFRARADAYLGLNSIGTADIGWQRFNSQFTVGLNYFFGKL